MLHRLLLSGLVAIGVAAAAMPSATAQRFTEVGAAGPRGAATALGGGFPASHGGPGRWPGLPPVRGSYSPPMRGGGGVGRELARLASRAILYRQPGLALRLQRAGDALSDELDE